MYESTTAADDSPQDRPTKQRRVCRRGHTYWGILGQVSRVCPTCHFERRNALARKRLGDALGDGSPRKCVKCGESRPPEQFHYYSNGAAGSRIADVCYPCHRAKRQRISNELRNRQKAGGSEDVINELVRAPLDEMAALNRRILAARRDGLTWRPDVQRMLARVAELRMELRIDTPTEHGATRGVVLAGWTGPANGLGAALHTPQP